MKSACFLLLSLITFWAKGDYLIASRASTLKLEASSSSDILTHIDKGVALALLDDGEQTEGYYKVIAPDGTEGWIYRTLVRRYKGSIGEAPSSSVGTTPSGTAPKLTLQSAFPPTKPGDVIVTHKEFTSCMSSKYLLPRWVGHKISSELLDGPGARSGSTYPSDPLFPGIKGNAYNSSGYDHGHLAPAGDFKRSQEATDDSFMMTNMTPQHGCMNQKGWCVLESNVRHWARQNPTSAFYLFSGPILSDFIDSLCINNTTTVYVPGQFYKVVVEQTANGTVRGAGFLVANGNVEFADLAGGKVSIDEIELMTGLNFMPSLNKTQEAAIENKIFNYELQNLPECGGSKSCDGIYSQRVRPEGRKQLKCKP